MPTLSFTAATTYCNNELSIIKVGPCSAATQKHTAIAGAVEATLSHWAGVCLCAAVARGAPAAAALAHPGGARPVTAGRRAGAFDRGQLAAAINAALQAGANPQHPIIIDDTGV